MNTVIIAIIIALLAGTIVIVSLIKPTDAKPKKTARQPRGNKRMSGKNKSTGKFSAKSSAKARQVPNAQTTKSQLKSPSTKSSLGSTPFKTEPSFAVKQSDPVTQRAEPVVTPIQPDSDNQIQTKQVEMQLTSEQKAPLREDDADSILGLSRERKIAKPEVKAPANAPRIMLYLKAEDDKPYQGYELLQALLSNGLRFGEMNLFHRHVEKTGKGEVLFSMAAATQEGIFDLQKMGDFTCSGLILFFNLGACADSMLAFNTMLETAGELTQDLGGQVLDQQYQRLTRDTALAMRAQVEQFSLSTV